MTIDDDDVFDFEAPSAKAPSVAKSWPNRPPPLQGELLSGWLSRVALANGLSPRSLFLILERDHDASIEHSEHSGGKARPRTAWVDFYLPDAIAAALEKRLGVSALILNGMRLGVKRGEGLSPLKMSAVACLIHLKPELMRQEAETTARPGYLGFCPQCLARSAWVSAWRRLTLATICVPHSRRLLEGCPNCGEAWKPHRGHDPRGLEFCSRCGESLADQRHLTGNVGMNALWRAWRMEMTLPSLARRLLAAPLDDDTRLTLLNDAIRTIERSPPQTYDVNLRDLLAAYARVAERRQNGPSVSKRGRVSRMIYERVASSVGESHDL